MKKETRHIESPAVGCMIGKAYQTLLSQLSKALQGAGLNVTTSEYLVLRALYSGDGIQQCEIASLTGKDKASICRCVAGLEKKGLVSTESVSHKCLKVFLAPKAKEIEPKIMEVAHSRHNALLDLTTPQEFEIFTKVLEKIITT
ncbi:MAG: MarR family winged helix-turn-helix transcriptional regulator [Muribaculaceae bacterium]|nr:MarR family winged helix-turn-helix transcriptional regulator [Muribaculaceae bacterium]